MLLYSEYPLDTIYLTLSESLGALGDVRKGFMQDRSTYGLSGVHDTCGNEHRWNAALHLPGGFRRLVSRRSPIRSYNMIKTRTAYFVFLLRSLDLRLLSVFI